MQAYAAADLTNYLRRLGRKPGIKEWQYRQAVEALRMLFDEVLELPWARDFDWSFWRDSGQPLESTHATIALTAFLERLAVRGNVSSSTQNQALSALVFLYREVLRRLRASVPALEQAQRGRVSVLVRRPLKAQSKPAAHGCAGRAFHRH